MSGIVVLKRSREEAIQTQRKFFKKTARGKVVKVLRERYLRSDIYCGIVSCSTCQQTQPPPSLPTTGFTTHPAYPSGHFILPDTNVFLHQMDLIENPLFTTPIILLQTVLEEVRHRSLPLYARLRQLTQAEDKSVWVFYNEFNSATSVTRKDEESPNDRNDRGIRTAAQWYNTHIAASRKKKSTSAAPPIVLLLTDDAANRGLAGSTKIPTSSVKDYVSGLPNASQLLDVLSSPGDEEIDPTRASGKRAVLYPEHLSVAACEAAIRTGHLCRGHFSASQYNYLEGSVNVPELNKPVLLVGRENMNRAVDGDVVAVELFPEKDWKAPGDEVIDQDSALKNDDPDNSDAEEGEGIDDDEEKLLERKQKKASNASQEKQPTGRIVGIIKRNWRAYVCHIDRTSLSSLSSGSSSLQTVFATPLSRAIPRIRLRTRQAPTLLDQKILVNIDAWTSTSRYPEGHFVRALGRVESKEAERESLLMEYEIPFRPFGRAVRECLPPEGDNWVVPQKVEDDPIWKGREDLRELLVCSIDPPGCQDIDDALHAKLLPNGNIEAGVHIADVSHFVYADTPMDHEAAARGTTVYLVDQRIDMLPSLLGTNLCSLRPFVERLAFSAIWELTPEAEIVNVRFTKSVIASKMAFTYEEAQKRKDDSGLNDELTESIRLLNKLAIKLKAARMRAGALNLASPEIKIHLNSSESSDPPVDVEKKELFETNSLVEEFMLLANVSVAKRILESFPQTAVLRRHLPPPRTNFEKLQQLLKTRKGIDLDVSSSGALAASLDKCIDPAEPAFNTLVRIMATRCMLSAEYFASGTAARDSFGHYGLASPIYTHFTSPIRRYADVLVHRQLSAAIDFAPLHPTMHSKNRMEGILNNVNRRHRMAQMASRASVEFYTGLAIRAQGKEGRKELAFVIKTWRNGLSVFVSALGLEGLIVFKETQFDAETSALTVKIEGKDETLNVFDKVMVEIGIQKDKNTQRGKVAMTLVSGPL